MHYGTRNTQYAVAVWSNAPRYSCKLSQFRSMLSIDRQPDREVAAHAHRALHRDATALTRDHRLAHRQPHPISACAFSGDERLEDMSLQIRRDADAGVLNLHKRLAIDRAGDEPQRAAIRHSIERVEDKIGERLP